jgi:hypothetical protein
MTPHVKRSLICAEFQIANRSSSHIGNREMTPSCTTVIFRGGRLGYITVTLPLKVPREKREVREEKHMELPEEIFSAVLLSLWVSDDNCVFWILEQRMRIKKVKNLKRRPTDKIVTFQEFNYSLKIRLLAILKTSDRVNILLALSPRIRLFFRQYFDDRCAYSVEIELRQQRQLHFKALGNQKKYTEHRCLSLFALSLPAVSHIRAFLSVLSGASISYPRPNFKAYYLRRTFSRLIKNSNSSLTSKWRLLYVSRFTRFRYTRRFAGT